MTFSLEVLPPRHLILGIDPGISGAIALFNTENRCLELAVDMPIVRNQARRGVKAKSLINIQALREVVGTYNQRILGCIIEDVGAAPGQGLSSTFKFGFVTGVVWGVVGAYGIPIHGTKPAVWKRLLGLSTDKALSRRMAAEVFPQQKLLFERVRDDGRAEAALLAKFGERIFGSSNG